jgi:hypothetical protein
MSTQTTLTLREPETVTIGPVSLVVERMKMTSVKDISEATTVSGTEVVTNAGRRVLRLTLTGRIHDDSGPMSFLLYINNLIPTNSGFTVTYRGLTFTGCHIQSFTAEDNGEEWIPVTVTLATPQSIVLAEVSE